VVVVFRASICAEIPMFRYRSIGVFLGMVMPTTQVAGPPRGSAYLSSSEAEVRERLVRLGHAVHFLALLHRTAATFRGFHQFAREAQRHRLLAALLGGFAQPAHRERHAAHRPHLDRHLVVGAADAPAL